MHDFRQPLSYWNARATRDPYSAVRSGWTREDFKTRFDETIVGMVSPFVPSGDLLDVGCGLGYICKLVAPRVDSYIGLDWSAGMIDHAREMNGQYENVSFVHGDGRTIPFADGSFDCIVSEQMFIHLDRDTARGYFGEIVRVARMEARLLLEVPKAGEYVNGWTIGELEEFFEGDARSMVVLPQSESSICRYIEVTV